MTTPNQPNDGHQSNGVTERIAPSPIPPRPIPRPSGTAENGPQGGGQPHEAPGNPGPEGGEAPQEGFDQETVRMGQSEQAKGPESGPKPGAGGQSQYKEGWSQLPQREPQSNLYRPGQSPVSGRPPASGNGGGVGLGGGVSNARTTADLAAKAARKEAAMVKSVGIDGPTRSIARPELIKDMPDLSEIRHPLPPSEPAAPSAPTPSSPAMPVAVAATVSGDPLRATVQVRRIDPWSTLKISLVISASLFVVWMLAVAILYIVLAGMGVWERLNNTFTDMVSQESGSVGLIDAGTVFGYAGVIGLINVVLFTALGTVAAFIYNQCCDLVGGIQVTLADPD
ncbi:DUF3566 domain-containing protein [Nocardia puris]|uniref:Transmembrane protein DUF3566 n=1 Tax=Nocardia puris TaxID=208602 RepID=A0A366DNL9_9NOCA|nr:DUF3566 domain-containing protein [Nocardia puris]MBF6213689.1 DUF3566 domain-containing protein [Nocardia puris]MBF6365381.1 DUF3566 domain-containing protein [Nocardia puris]MBF6459847.1 DUF3566 domain-containing protein [Nocardia puris]RBO91672.1 transmembrane protein DUF3566 [Nocardia puris]